MDIRMSPSWNMIIVLGGIWASTRASKVGFTTTIITVVNTAYPQSSGTRALLQKRQLGQKRWERACGTAKPTRLTQRVEKTLQWEGVRLNAISTVAPTASHVRFSSGGMSTLSGREEAVGKAREVLDTSLAWSGIRWTSLAALGIESSMGIMSATTLVPSASPACAKERRTSIAASVQAMAVPTIV